MLKRYDEELSIDIFKMNWGVLLWYWNDMMRSSFEINKRMEINFNGLKKKLLVVVRNPLASIIHSPFSTWEGWYLY